jgi:hypothetical protein
MTLDPEVERRLRQMAAPEPVVPESVYRYANAATQRNRRGRWPLSAGRFTGRSLAGPISLIGVGLAIVMAVALAGVLLSVRSGAVGGPPAATSPAATSPAATSPAASSTPTETPSPTPCRVQPMRTGAAQALVNGGAVIVYERNGGLSCIDDLFAIYPDGRIISNDGYDLPKTRQVEAAVVATLVAKIVDVGFFTDIFYTTYHLPCAACSQYSVTVKDGGQTKTVGAVDGGTDGPAMYWQVIAYLAELLYPNVP